MVKDIEQGDVVRDYFIGNTRVKICDDYCRNQTPEEVDAILKRVACRALEQFSSPADETRCAPIEVTT